MATALPSVDKRAVSVHKARVLPLLPPQDRVPMVTPTPATPLIISVSELGAFLRCRVRWYWSYQVGLRRLTDKTEYRSIGIAVHDILEAFYREPLRRRTRQHMRATIDAYMAPPKKGAPPRSALQRLEPKSLELVRGMCMGYAAWARTEDAAIGLDTSSPEEWFELPLVKDGSIKVRGKIDNRFEPTVLKRTLACQETKTKGQIDVSVIDLNFQLSTYLWALREQFPKYKRYEAHYTILRRQMPGPRVRAALFHRTAVSRSDEEVDRWVRDVRLMVADMAEGPRIYPNVTRECTWDCDFYNPCLLRADRADVRHVLRSEYTTEKEAR